MTSDDLLTAVGGLWKFYREFQPLAPFLITRAQSGRVFLGGLDDQLGQNYANLEMVTELTDLLPQPKRQSCVAALHKKIYSQYPETAPYSEADRSQIDDCLEAMQAASSTASSITLVKQEQQEMISATQRWISRDFSSGGGESIANRDRSMFQTFEWLQSRLPKKH